jgi:hypothetical protein
MFQEFFISLFVNRVTRAVEKRSIKISLQKYWLFLTGGRYSEVPFFSKCGKWESIIVVIVDK